MFSDWKKFLLESDQKQEDCGLFIRLPERLAMQYPKSKKDNSPKHVTMIYLGELVPEQIKMVDHLLSNQSKLIKHPIDVKLGELNYFENEDNIAFNEIIFEHSTYELRTFFKVLLLNKLNIKEKWPKWVPHTTISYESTEPELWHSGKYISNVPEGDFRVDSIEFWFGDNNKKSYSLID